MSDTNDKKLVLLDGHALVYRSHFAVINRPMINGKGINTSAMFGFTRTLWDLMKKQKDTEDKILHLLSNAEGNILDNEVLISELNNSKLVS